MCDHTVFTYIPNNGIVKTLTDDGRTEKYFSHCSLLWNSSKICKDSMKTRTSYLCENAISKTYNFNVFVRFQGYYLYAYVIKANIILLTNNVVTLNNSDIKSKIMEGLVYE